MSEAESMNERLDGRVVMTPAERGAASAAVRTLCTNAWMRENLNASAELKYEALHDLVDAVQRAINQRRLGYPEGTVATHPDGRIANRYYSVNQKRLVWLVIQPPTDDGLEVDSGPELPGDGWVVSKQVAWQVVS